MIDSFPRLYKLPKSSFFLLGIRGVGKSTWVKTHLPNALAIDLLDERLHHDLLVDPALFSALLSETKPNAWVVVDEVQRIPRLLNDVHRFIENKRLRFALLGSSARKLKASGTNLLAGRALMKTMFPLTPEELGKEFWLDAALRYGTVPLIWTSEDRNATLESYVQLYLREEIRAEALVRNLAGFVRFLPIAALFHGQTINTAGIARDAGVSRTTVQGYFDILEDTLLTTRLPAYEAKLRVRERRLPKLYWVDSGVVRAIKRQLGAVTAEEMGPLFEGWVHTLLRTYQERLHVYDTLSYWAPANTQTEVDFLLQRDREFVAIEVKATTHYQTGLLKGLNAIAELKNVKRRVLLYQGARSFRTTDGIEVWTVARFCEELVANRLWA